MNDYKKGSGKVRRINAIDFVETIRDTQENLTSDRPGSFGIYTDLTNLEYERKHDKNVPRFRVIKNSDKTVSIYIEKKMVDKNPEYYM
jgi:hypothetical protein